MAHIGLDRVTKTFAGHTALKDLSLDIADGQFFVLLGPTGAGKTTTLRLIAGLDRPDSGTISLDHQNVGEWSAAERDVALVLQQYSLYPRYTVRQNLEFPLKSKRRQVSQPEIDASVARAAGIVRVTHLLDRKTDRLSGGEMQRVSIGRAIVRRPRVFLMDEPLSNLDAKLREALRAELKDLKLKLGATFLYVTHDHVEAMSMGDRIAILKGGRIVQIGTPADIYERPTDVFVAGFVGSPTMNLMAANAADGRAVVVPGRFIVDLRGLPDGAARRASGRLTLGIRAEDIRIGPDGTSEAEVENVENHGVEKVVTLRVGAVPLRATIAATERLTLGDKVRFSLDPARLHVFDAENGLRMA